MFNGLSPHIYTLIYILYILMYNNHIQGHQDKNKKQKKSSKTRNTTVRQKHDKTWQKGLDKLIAAKQTFYQ